VLTEITDRMLIFGEWDLRTILASTCTITTGGGPIVVASFARPGPTTKTSPAINL
jgi:hypothetical protein